MTSPQFAITVFTATFNRAHTIERVYRSLRTQTFRDFEWLVVDDGSTDETGALVRRWAAEADFPIHYVWQENRGKHRAYNRAVGLARGQLFLDFDSDDACVPRALERFQHHWEAIPAPERSRFSTVAALCVDDRGEIMGTKFSTPITDSHNLEARFRYHVTGEKWGIHRTEVLRQFPFPDVDGSHVPEGIMWARIGRQFKTRYVNEVLRVYHTDQPSLTRSGGLVVNPLVGRLERDRQAALRALGLWVGRTAAGPAKARAPGRGAAEGHPAGMVRGKRGPRPHSLPRPSRRPDAAGSGALTSATFVTTKTV